MKRFMLLMFLLASMFPCLKGQQTSSNKTYLEGDGYTYVHEVTHGGYLVKLYNKENKYTYKPLVYKDTGEEPPFDLREKRVEDDWTHDKTMTIINGAFSLDQKLSVSGRKFSIAIYIDSTTGKIMEVDYDFQKKGPFSKIPLSVFREIEVKLKEQVYFTLTEAGKKVNYVYLGWMHEVK